MEIRTRDTGAHTAGAGNNRLGALNGALKADDITQREEAFASKSKKPEQAGRNLIKAGGALTQKGKNAMTEAASQDEDAADAGDYATDRVINGAKGTAAKAVSGAEQGSEKTVDKVREEIRKRRKERQCSRSAEGQSKGSAEYGNRFHGPEYSGNGAYRGGGGQESAFSARQNGYRFSSGKWGPGTEGRHMGTGGRYTGTESRFYGTEGSAVKADMPEEETRFRIQEKPDMSIKLKDRSVRSAEHRIRMTAKQAAEAAKATAKTAKAVGEAVFRAVSAVTEKLAAACASGGPFILIIIIAAVYIGVIMYQIGNIADKMLSIFSLGGAIVWEGDVENLEEMIADAHMEPNPAITALNDSYHDRLDRIIRNNKHDEVVLEEPDPDWGDILGFWAAWQLCINDGEFPDMAKSGMEGLDRVFNDMVNVEFEVTEEGADTGDSDSTSGSESGEGGAHGGDEGEENDENPEPEEEEENEKLILTITVSQLSIDEMAKLYELGEDGEDYIELMTDGSLFEVINILTKYIEGYELPEEPEEGESGGHSGGGGSF